MSDLTTVLVDYNNLGLADGILPSIVPHRSLSAGDTVWASDGEIRCRAEVVSVRRTDLAPTRDLVGVRVDLSTLEDEEAHDA